MWICLPDCRLCETFGAVSKPAWSTWLCHKVRMWSCQHGHAPCAFPVSKKTIKSPHTQEYIIKIASSLVPRRPRTFCHTDGTSASGPGDAPGSAPWLSTPPCPQGPSRQCTWLCQGEEGAGGLWLAGTCRTFGGPLSPLDCRKCRFRIFRMCRRIFLRVLKMNIPIYHQFRSFPFWHSYCSRKNKHAFEWQTHPTGVKRPICCILPQKIPLLKNGVFFSHWFSRFVIHFSTRISSTLTIPPKPLKY